MVSHNYDELMHYYALFWFNTLICVIVICCELGFVSHEVASNMDVYNGENFPHLDIGSQLGKGD